MAHENNQKSHSMETNFIQSIYCIAMAAITFIRSVANMDAEWSNSFPQKSMQPWSTEERLHNNFKSIYITKGIGLHCVLIYR